MFKRNNKEKDDVAIKRIAKLRFKRVVRVALANNHWIADSDDQAMTMNVKKNVAMLIRKKHKTGILTMAQKGLLATPHETRSVAERKQLCAIVASLSCFNQIPPIIRARLVAPLNFMLVRGGRTLMQEGDSPIFVYFVVSGSIEMSKNIMNKNTRKFEQKPMVLLGPGDWIGEVGLIENTKRVNTYKTITDSEILVLDEFDFNKLLMPYVKKVWLEKKRAIASLSYLKFMTPTQIVSACKFGILRQYNPLDTIYPDDRDNTHVHFVLSGECVLLQCLRMRVTNVNGEWQYELLSVTDEGGIKEDEYVRGESFDVGELLRSISSLDEALILKKKQKRKLEFERIMANCKVLLRKREHERHHHHHHHVRGKSIMVPTKIGEETVMEEFEDFYEYSTENEADADESLSKSQTTSAPFTSSKSDKIEEHFEVEPEEAILNTTHSTITSIKSESSNILNAHPGNYSTRFIDVGSMTFGGLFGVGERADLRVVMARTTVQCLLIPLFWLMEDDQNPGHIWQRMRFYLDRCIPTREKLFSDFTKSRKWTRFKEECVEPFTHSTTNPTKIEDIPIVIRIVETKHSEPDYRPPPRHKLV